MANSVYFNILDALKVSIANVFPNTFCRVKPVIFETTDALPICVISPGPKGEQISQIVFGKGTHWLYDVNVMYCDKGNRLVSENALSPFLLNRELIRNQLFQIPSNLNLGNTIFDIDFNTLEAIGFPEFKETEFYTTGWMFSIKSYEIRQGV